MSMNRDSAYERLLEGHYRFWPLAIRKDWSPFTALLSYCESGFIRAVHPYPSRLSTLGHTIIRVLKISAYSNR